MLFGYILITYNQAYNPTNLLLKWTYPRPIQVNRSLLGVGAFDQSHQFGYHVKKVQVFMVMLWRPPLNQNATLLKSLRCTAKKYLNGQNALLFIIA